MNSEERREILLAISLGWKSPAELKNLPEFSDESFISELESLQNDLSFLPSTLLIENPPSQLKDKVARKLYRIKDEIKSKVKEIEIKPTPIEVEVSTPQKSDKREENIERSGQTPATDLIFEPNETLEDNKTELLNNDEFEEVGSIESVSASLENQLQGLIGKVKEVSLKESSDLGNDEPGITINEEEDGRELSIPQSSSHDFRHQTELRRNNFEDDQSKKKSYSFQIIAFILFFIVVIGLVIIYFKFSSEVKNYQMQVDHLNEEISTLSTQFEGNSSLQDILDSKELRIVNLQRANKIDNGFAKIFLDPVQGRGVLQLSELPAIEAGKAYHLWGNVAADFYSLKVFTSSQRIDFQNFTFSDFLIQPGSKFLLIEDPDSKTDAPGDKILFEGIVQ